MSTRIATIIAPIFFGVWVASLGAQSGQNPEELARRHYELGLDFMQSQKYAEALKDFHMVVESYPASAVAGDALVELARYHLDVARNPSEAQKATEMILKKYPSSAAAASAYVLNGRLTIARSRTAADVDTALASFQRVPSLFPGSDAIPASIYYAGEVLRVARRNDDALDQYRDVTLKYPGSVWAARALIGAAICLTQTGRPIMALEALQRVRAMFPGSMEAATALSWNTILYRLYVRGSVQPAYVYSGRMLGNPTLKFRDVAAVTADARDNILLVHKTAVTVFDTKGAVVKSLNADGASAVALTLDGEPLVVRENVLSAEDARRISLAIRGSDGKLKPVEEIPTAVATATGSWLIADRKNKAIQLFAADGKYEKPFASTPVDRFAVNMLADVAALDRDGKQLALFDWTGKPIGRISTRGAGYELDEPVDVAFDPIGHLYVLDRAKASVFVFNPQGKLVTTFSMPEKSPGAFHKAVAFGLDSAARLYIFDDRAQHVQVFQ